MRTMSTYCRCHCDSCAPKSACTTEVVVYHPCRRCAHLQIKTHPPLVILWKILYEKLLNTCLVPFWMTARLIAWWVAQHISRKFMPFKIIPSAFTLRSSLKWMQLFCQVLLIILIFRSFSRLLTFHVAQGKCSVYFKCKVIKMDLNRIYYLLKSRKSHLYRVPHSYFT